MSKSTYSRNRFVGSAPDDLGVLCNVCFDIPCEPVQCNSGHIFCELCMGKSFRLKKACPVCSTPMKRSDIGFPKNLIGKNVIQTLEVTCEHDPEHCPWSGPLSTHDVHPCNYRPFKCLFQGCLQMVNAITQEDHQAVCPRRLVACEHCQHPFAFVLQHQNACPERPVVCECGVVSTASRIAGHKADDCVLNHVECPLFAVDMCSPACTGHVMKTKLTAHLEAINSTLFVVKMATEMKSLKRKLSVLDETRNTTITAVPITNDVIKVYKNGDIYRGVMDLQQRRNGHGVYKQANNGTIQTGIWYQNVLTGKGSEWCKDSVITNDHWRTMDIETALKNLAEPRVGYEGEWKHGVKCGHGSTRYECGNSYKGLYSGGRLNGHGVYTFPTRDYYEGMFVDGMFCGIGTRSDPSGNVYVGEWKNDKRNGKGVWTSADKSEIYDGFFVGNLRHGQGKWTVNGEIIYEGLWENGLRVLSMVTITEPIQGAVNDIKLTNKTSQICCCVLFCSVLFGFWLM